MGYIVDIQHFSIKWWQWQSKKNMGTHCWRLVTNYNYNILYIFIYINVYKFCVHVFCMCERISFFCCHCHHLAIFICKSLNINALKNYSFTFLTKTVIIFYYLSSFLSSFCRPDAWGCTLSVKFAAWWPKSVETVNFVKKHPFSGLICAKSV